MTPRDLAIIRCCAEPTAKYENAAVIQGRAFMHHGIEKHKTMDTLTALANVGYLARLKKGPGKYQYRRTDKGQAALAQEVTV